MMKPSGCNQTNVLYLSGSFSYKENTGQRFIREALFWMLGPVNTISANANVVKTAPIKARDDGKAGALPRSATPSGAVLTTFPPGCGQKGHAPRCEALPDIESGCVSRLARDLFDSQRILQK